MAIDTITPVTNSVVNPGDSCSFLVDDTYTSLVITVISASGTEIAYDTGASGAQAGYTVSVTNSGGRDTFVLSRAAGWDMNPQQIEVVENETGSSVSTSFTYNLSNVNKFPQSASPYNSYEGTMIITDAGVAVRSDVGWIDAVGMTVVDLGNGKVRLTAGGGGGGSMGQWLKGASTIGTPTTGTFDTDAATPSTVTSLRVYSAAPTAGVDVNEVMNALPLGYVILQDTSDPSNVALVFEVTAAAANGANNTDLTVAYVARAGDDTFSANNYSVLFVPKVVAPAGFRYTYATGGGLPAAGTFTASHDLTTSITSIRLADVSDDGADYKLVWDGLIANDKLILRSDDGSKIGTWVVVGSSDVSASSTITVTAGDQTGTLVAGDIASFEVVSSGATSAAGESSRPTSTTRLAERPAQASQPLGSAQAAPSRRSLPSDFTTHPTLSSSMTSGTTCELETD